MSHTLAARLLSPLSQLIASQMGLSFPEERWHDLERGIHAIAQECGFQDVESCARWLLSSQLTRPQVESLASHLTVGETYFFRESRSFEAFEAHILPAVIRSRQGREQYLRIWSAGCCTGEEAYSIAISVSKAMANVKDWKITILATDINPHFLRKAANGLYGEWSFRDVPQWIKERYFKKAGDRRFEIVPSIKNMVTFSHLNLAEAVYPSLLNDTNAMDVIFCRNVLMYFVQERMKNIIHNLYRSLVDGGWLIVSPSEASHTLFSQFAPASFPGTIFYKKDSKAPYAGEDFLSRGLPSFPWPEDKKVSFQPTPEVVREPQPEVALSPHSRDSAPSDVEEPHTTAAQPSPYTEALALYEHGRYAEAAETLIALFSHAPRTPEGMALIARAYANQGKLVEAQEWSEHAIVEDKLNAGLYYLRATILQEQGNLDEATVSLKRALYLDQRFVLAHFALGNLARRRQKFREADKHFQNALSLLSTSRQDDVLPESDGMTAGRLMEIIRSTTAGEKSA